MRRSVLPLLALPLLAASPGQKPLSLVVPLPRSPALPLPPKPPAVAAPSAYQPAPLPNRGLNAPLARSDDTATSLAPTLFTNKDTYRGEGFIKGSTAQAEQDRRARPTPGFSLVMPFAPN